MNSTRTAIAVALALAVVIAFLVFPGLSPFYSNNTSQGATSTNSSINNNAANQTSSTSMTTTNSSDQLQSTDEVIGTGATAEVGDSVTVNYVGSLTNGTIFDASANHGTSGFTFTLGAGQVIKGWDEGIVGMKVGGKRRLVIPASLAYGSQAVGNVIPPNSTLIFEVELLKVQPPTQ